MKRTYGSITLDGSKWVIETEPQVRLRIKRVFERIDKGEFGKITLSATPENTRELEWFLQRYPMDMVDGDQERLSELAEEHRTTELLVHKILEDDYEAPDFEMAIQPRNYQKVAADLAIKTGRLLIADDLGLGKTCTGICTLTDPSNLPALVVTLTHLTRQWESEINKFAPKLRTHVVKKGSPYDMTKVKQRGKKPDKKVLFPDVIIMNYHKLRGWADSLEGVVNSVIYDECQELRREESLKYKAAKHVSSGCRMKVGLSATPIYNYGGEIYSVMDAIHPGALGTRYEFIVFR